MNSSRTLQIGTLVCAHLVLVLTSNGCTTTTPKVHSSTRSTEIVAFLDGSPILRSQIHPSLSELAGYKALSEYTLDRLLDEQFRRRGLTLSQSDIDRELKVIQETLAPNQESGEIQEIVFEQFKDSRSLGPTRMKSLLKRNAMLRKLIPQDLEPSKEQIELALKLARDDLYTLRLFMGSDLQSTIGSREAVLNAPQEYRSAIMTKLCLESSTHSSSSAGGLISNLSPMDPSTPQSLSDQLGSNQPNQISEIIPHDQGFMFYIVEQINQQDKLTDSDRDQIILEITRRIEQQSMADIARDLLEQADLIITDPSLHWSRTRPNPRIIQSGR